MNRRALAAYRCPENHDQLAIQEGAIESNEEIVNGTLISVSGREYQIWDGIPDFTYPELLGASDSGFRKEYDAAANSIYDNYIDWLFQVFYEDETTFRERIIDLLKIEENSRVLEVGCGTGRDTVHIARCLKKGVLHVQDLSSQMIKHCRSNLQRSQLSPELTVDFFVGNGAYLPFPDGYFDAAFHFGGINEFSEKKKAIYELTRVVRTGGKVVFGDESMAPWLREREFGKMLMNNNRLFEHTAPIELLPENAHHARIEWVLGNAFYVIDYTVGQGLPAVNLDLPHKGRRGGTIRTRYAGQLEGVTVETKQLAQRAVGALGLSMHEWLDSIVRQKAEELLRNGSHGIGNEDAVIDKDKRETERT